MIRTHYTHLQSIGKYPRHDGLNNCPLPRRCTSQDMDSAVEPIVDVRLNKISLEIFLQHVFEEMKEIFLW